MESESSLDSISVETVVFMGRPTNESFNWTIDYRVEIMAAFLAFFKFELVSGDRKCVYSDWYVEDIADYWKS